MRVAESTIRRPAPEPLLRLLVLTASIASITAARSSSEAESILLTTTTSAMRRLVSPGWKRVSWPGRSGSATTM